MTNKKEAEKNKNRHRTQVDKQYIGGLQATTRINL